ncbi:MAG: hypothetical protein NTZ67_03720 [Gammaproteobacteria bacterium]|nr:hypothetical protein [Gammaproteobacteria bacterium]
MRADNISAKAIAALEEGAPEAAQMDIFDFLKHNMLSHCDIQLERLRALRTQFKNAFDKALKDELQNCIDNYKCAIEEIAAKKFSGPCKLGVSANTTIAGNLVMPLVLIGSLSVIPNPAAFMVLYACPEIFGIGYSLNATSRVSFRVLMPIVAKAEEKAEAFFVKANHYATKNNKTDLKNKLDIEQEKFKTESAHLKTRVAFYAICAAHFIAAAIILAASHGALTPLAVQIAMMGIKHLSVGLAVGSNIVLGIGFFASAKSLPGRRVTKLQTEDRENSVSRYLGRPKTPETAPHFLDMA